MFKLCKNDNIQLQLKRTEKLNKNGEKLQLDGYLHLNNVKYNFMYFLTDEIRNPERGLFKKAYKIKKTMEAFNLNFIVLILDSFLIHFFGFVVLNESQGYKNLTKMDFTYLLNKDTYFRIVKTDKMRYFFTENQKDFISI